MPTTKPRVTFTISPEKLSEVENFQFGNKIKNQTQAILTLIEKGLSDFESGIKNAPSISDEAMKIARDYDNLDGHGKSIVRVILNEEQNRIKEFGHLERRPMIQAAASGGGVDQIEAIRPDELPIDEEPLP